MDPRPTSRTIRNRLRRYRRATELIVENPEIQGGAATFKGTRIPVHQIAALFEQGVPEEELREDYPHLMPEMIAAARIYTQANPRRGRPPKPAWRNSKPRMSQVISRRRA